MTEATELVEGYRTGALSPVEATQQALDAIERYDDQVNAFVLVDAEGALAAAKESETRWHAGTPLGPGDGVPTSIKDALWTKGWPTLRGSTMIDPAGPWDEDAPSVARLRETGAVILGKTTTPEYSWKGVTDSFTYGATGNPWDPARTSGGSSGGSATAVGLGMGVWSLGTDGGGSVRIPAAFTGTVALKPTYGLIPLFPPSAFGTLSHAGPRPGPYAMRLPCSTWSPGSTRATGLRCRHRPGPSWTASTTAWPVCGSVSRPILVLLTIIRRSTRWSAPRSASSRTSAPR